MRKDYSNQKKFRLTALHFSHRFNKKTYWKVKCDCGTEKKIDIRSFGRSAKSCGCLHKERVKSKLEFGESSVRRIYSDYQRQNSKYRKTKHEFQLSFEQFKELTKQNCYYCDSPPSQKAQTKTSFGYYLYNGIDRLNNQAGYISSNCVPCCKTCNFAKGLMNYEEFIHWIERVYVFFYKKN